MSSSKKIDLLRDFAAGVYRLEIHQSCWYFRPSFVNCCPSPLLSGLTFPPTPLPYVKKYTVYTYTVCIV